MMMWQDQGRNIRADKSEENGNMNNETQTHIQIKVKHIATVAFHYLFEAPSMPDPNLSYLSLLLLLLPLAILLSLYVLVRPRPVKIPIKGRHVFITGGSSGIGLALEEAKQAIRLSTGIDVAVFAADVRDYDAVSKAINEAEPIDVLIVNQGVFVPQELEKQGLDEIRFMMDVNLMGTFHMIKAALP
jgi:3-dehydrosphinganine reductase